MSVSVSRAKLMASLKELQGRWRKAQLDWDDPVSQKLNDRVLEPLEPKVRAAVVAIEKISAVLARVRKECE